MVRLLSGDHAIAVALISYRRPGRSGSAGCQGGRSRRALDANGPEELAPKTTDIVAGAGLRIVGKLDCGVSSGAMGSDIEHPGGIQGAFVLDTWPSVPVRDVCFHTLI
jgi:hypothetical protein